MELTPTLILNLALLIVPPVALVLVFRQWLARHIRWTVALTALCDDGARDGADRSGRRHEAADGSGFVPGNVGGGWQYGAWQDLQEPAGCRGRQIPHV